MPVKLNANYAAQCDVCRRHICRTSFRSEVGSLVQAHGGFYAERSDPVGPATIVLCRPCLARYWTTNIGAEGAGMAVHVAAWVALRRRRDAGRP